MYVESVKEALMQKFFYLFQHKFFFWLRKHFGSGSLDGHVLDYVLELRKKEKFTRKRKYKQHFKQRKEIRDRGILVPFFVLFTFRPLHNEESNPKCVYRTKERLKTAVKMKTPISSICFVGNVQENEAYRS